MTRSEWLTILALIAGPVLALFAQRAVDWAREKKRRRESLFLALMSTRAAFLSLPHVQALNSIVVVFNKRSDLKITEAWRKVLEHASTPPMTPAGAPTPGWMERYNDLKADLLQAMGTAVGYEFTGDDLKRLVYTPVGHGQAEMEGEYIRQTMVKVLTADGLKVKIHQEPGGPPIPPASK